MFYLARPLTVLLATAAIVVSASRYTSTRSVSYGVADLGTLGGNRSSAFAMTADEPGFPYVVGSAATAAGVVHAFEGGPYGPLRDLGTLGGTHSEARPYVGALVVGRAQVATRADHAFSYESPGPMKVLGTLGGPIATPPG